MNVAMDVVQTEQKKKVQIDFDDCGISKVNWTSIPVNRKRTMKAAIDRLQFQQ
jgi:hypothetical protein